MIHARLFTPSSIIIILPPTPSIVILKGLPASCISACPACPGFVEGANTMPYPTSSNALLTSGMGNAAIIASTFVSCGPSIIGPVSSSRDVICGSSFSAIIFRGPLNPMSQNMAPPPLLSCPRVFDKDRNLAPSTGVRRASNPAIITPSSNARATVPKPFLIGFLTRACGAQAIFALTFAAAYLIRHPKTVAALSLPPRQ